MPLRGDKIKNNPMCGLTSAAYGIKNNIVIANEVKQCSIKDLSSLKRFLECGNQFSSRNQLFFPGLHIPHPYITCLFFFAADKYRK